MSSYDSNVGSPDVCEYGFQLNADGVRHGDERTEQKSGLRSSQFWRLLHSPKQTAWDQYLETVDQGNTRLSRTAELKQLIRYFGIPKEKRGQVWMRLTGAQEQLENNLLAYADIIGAKKGELTKATYEIEKDVYRSMPDNVMFRSEEGIEKLRNVLTAFSWIRPEVGYCQAMNFIAAMLLLFLDEESSFWLLKILVDKIIPPDYYTNSMIGVEIDTYVLNELLALKLPKVHEHINKLEIDLRSVTLQWFLSVFLNILPLEPALRFLDCFLFEGQKMLFRTALALFKMFEGRILKEKSFETLLEYLKSIPGRVGDASVLFSTAFDKIWLGGLPQAKIDSLREEAREKIIKEKKIRKEKAAIQLKHSSTLLALHKRAEANKKKSNQPKPVKVAYRPKSWRVEIYEPLTIIDEYTQTETLRVSGEDTEILPSLWDPKQIRDSKPESDPMKWTTADTAGNVLGT